MNNPLNENCPKTPGLLPSVFVIGASTTLLMHPWLVQMTAGLLDYTRKGMETGRLSEELASAMTDLDTPQGASAGDTSRVLAYLGVLQRVQGFRPDMTLMHVGLHDIRTNSSTGERQISHEQYVVNIDRIADWFSARGLRLAWMTCGPLDEQVHNRHSTAFHRYERDVMLCNQAISEMVQRRNIPLVDIAAFTASLGPLPELLKDHIHFNETVVKLQSAFVVGSLKSLVG